MDRIELKKRRQSLGMTQAQMAGILGVQPNTVTRWETGNIPIVPPAVALAVEALERRQRKKAR